MDTSTSGSESPRIEQETSLLDNNNSVLFDAKGDRRDWKRSWKNLIILALLVSNTLLIFGLVFQTTALHSISTIETNPTSIAIVPALPLKPVTFHWYTPWSSENDTEADVLWNAIRTDHGFIGIEHGRSAQLYWLESMPVPGDEGKGLYLLESYHQLHCLRIVRKMFLESINDQPMSYSVQHVRHCFDYFRQFVMCHADNTPLYTLGRHTSGDGQVHMCKDWTALRDYATENSACFKDRVGTETLREQFGNCDDGIDGLEDV